MTQPEMPAMLDPVEALRRIAAVADPDFVNRYSPDEARAVLTGIKNVAERALAKAEGQP